MSILPEEDPNKFVRDIDATDLIRLILPRTFTRANRHLALTKCTIRCDETNWVRHCSIIRENGWQFIGGNGWERLVKSFGMTKDFTLIFRFDGINTFRLEVFNEDFVQLQLTETEFELGPTFAPLPVAGSGTDLPHGQPTIAGNDMQLAIVSYSAPSNGTSSSRAKGKGKSKRRVSVNSPIPGFPPTRRSQAMKARYCVAYQRAAAQHFESPYCTIIIMQESYLEYTKNLVIPLDFARQNIVGQSHWKTLMIEGYDPFKAECAFYNEVNGRIKASSWNSFVYLHSLKFADVIVLRVDLFLDDVWHVDIFRN